MEATPDRDVFDITIIGGGPAGLFAAFYAGLRRARTKILDSLPELGGQLTALYPEKYIYDMPGFPAVLAKDLAAAMIRQAMAFQPEIRLGERVAELQRESDGVFRLTTDRDAHFTRTVVIAAGAGAFSPKRLGRPAVDDWEGRGLRYGGPEGGFGEGRRVLIVGGGDSAVDWALHLEHRAAAVTLIHRRDEFRAHEDSVRRLMESGVDVRTFRELRALDGDDRVRRAVLADTRTREEETLEVDAVLANLGFHADLGPIKHWGLATKGADILVNSRMETSVPGVYACGDVATYEGKLKLIATGVGEAAAAVNNAKHLLDPSAKVFPGHSTNLAAPPASTTATG